MVDGTDINTLSKFDVIKFAKDIINEVESVRAYRETTDDKTEQKNHTPIESKINAFFRLVGLPMFVTLESQTDKKTDRGDLEGVRHLTPGFYGATLDEYIIKNMNTLGNLKDRPSSEGAFFRTSCSSIEPVISSSLNTFERPVILLTGSTFSVSTLLSASI